MRAAITEFTQKKIKFTQKFEHATYEVSTATCKNQLTTNVNNLIKVSKWW